MKFDQDLVNQIKGKIIESVDTHTVNMVCFRFTDGSKLELDTEYVMDNLYGFGGRYESSAG